LFFQLNFKYREKYFRVLMLQPQLEPYGLIMASVQTLITSIVMSLSRKGL